MVRKTLIAAAICSSFILGFLTGPVVKDAVEMARGEVINPYGDGNYNARWQLGVFKYAYYYKSFLNEHLSVKNTFPFEFTSLSFTVPSGTPLNAIKEYRGLRGTLWSHVISFLFHRRDASEYAVADNEIIALFREGRCRSLLVYGHYDTKFEEYRKCSGNK